MEGRIVYKLVVMSTDGRARLNPGKSPWHVLYFQPHFALNIIKWPTFSCIIVEISRSILASSLNMFQRV